jgi:hypothetical protein
MIMSDLYNFTFSKRLIFVQKIYDYEQMDQLV